MKVRVTEHRADSGSARISVVGELDLDTAAELDRPVTEALDAGAPTILIDLSECPFIDSSVLAVMLRAVTRADGISSIAVAAAGQPRDVLRITGIDARIPVYDTVAEAEQALAPGGQQDET